MNEPLPPTPPPPPTAPTPPPPTAPQQPPKKGLSPLAWVAIGCAGLLIVAGLVAAVGGAFVMRKAKQKLGDFEKNPAMATAELVVRANPDLELVDSDADAGTLTIRDKKTGEEVTVDFEDVKEGKISFSKDGEESTLAVGGEGSEGALTVTGPEGETVFRAGAGNAGDIPDWVPIYPDTTPAGSYRMTTAEGISGAFSLTTTDTPQEVLDYYGGRLGEMGGEVERSTFSSSGTEGGILAGGTADGSRKLNVTVAGREGATTVTVTFSASS